MSRIKVIDYENAEGRLKEIYDEIICKRKKLADVHKIQSLRPESIVKHMELYYEIMFSRSQLSRAEREMMAVITSISNGCDYCRMHHSEALLHYWKNNDKLEALIKDYKTAGLSEREITLCAYAEELTKSPDSFANKDKTEILRNVGISDEGILDASLVVAYFNFVNRIVISLLLEPNYDEVKGYDY